MNYSFLEPLTELAFRPLTAPTVTPVPTELDDLWKTFEKDLGGFKTQYAKARASVTVLNSRLSSKKSDINFLEVTSKVLKSDELKAKVSKVIEDYEEAEGVNDLESELGIALGRAEAMKHVLMDTNSERYARFVCFVCMDSLVDTFLVPCNHVMCERCWFRIQGSSCPGCRQDVNDVRKIFTLS